MKDIMVGDDAAAVRTMLQITYPVSPLEPPAVCLEWRPRETKADCGGGIA